MEKNWRPGAEWPSHWENSPSGGRVRVRTDFRVFWMSSRSLLPVTQSMDDAAYMRDRVFWI